MKQTSSTINLVIKYALIIAAMLFLVFIPEELIYHDGASLCIFKNVTGIQCPLCGMTRASCDILHFRFLSALSYNPISLFLPLLLIMEVYHDFHKGPLLKNWRRFLFIIFIVSLILLFIYRIIPHFSIFR